jgi:DNA adenine methylase
VEFWQCLLEEPEALASETEKYFPLNRKAFYALQQHQTSLPDKISRAAAYFVLNRSSFSGSTLSGGMSPHHPRFTRNSIERIRSFYNPNLSVNQGDFRASLEMHPDVFAYLDPPYLIRNTLYGRKGNAHKNFDHEGLAEILKKRSDWILSYNDCPAIRKMYAGFSMLHPKWKYGMSADKNSREVLIFSK